MKVLSIKEPFASLISLGIKKIETRSWKTNYKGEIYIHASLTKSKMDDKRKMPCLNYYQIIMSLNKAILFVKGI